jgi:hypothetical protein
MLCSQVSEINSNIVKKSESRLRAMLYWVLLIPTTG